MIEVQCICACLERKDFSFLRLNDIDEKYFPNYRDEYKFIEEHVNKYGNVPDQATFIEKFREFPFETVAETSNYLIDKIREEETYNFTVRFLNDVAARFKKGEDSRKVVADMSSKLPELSRRMMTFEATDLIHNFEQRYNKYEERSNDLNKAFFNFGINELDAVTGGIDRSEELGVISASTGQGKSWWAIFIGLSVAKQGYKVGYYSGEMSKETVGWRIDTEYSHISNFALTRGNKYIKEEYRRHLEELRKNVSGSFYCATPEDFGDAPTVSKLGSFIEKYDLDFLLIDQLSLVSDSGSLKKRDEAYANISKDLKLLQGRKHIPIFSVSQLNRGAQDKDVVDPGTNNISGSNRIAEDATLVLSIKQTQKGTLELRIMKARNCPSGSKLTYNWKIDTFDLVYVKTEDDVYVKHLAQQEKKGIQQEKQLSEKEIYKDNYNGTDPF
ncbi:MAG: DnaB-like helicase C-terminal domain-containing protein [Bacilli bacterium]